MPNRPTPDDVFPADFRARAAQEAAGEFPGRRPFAQRLSDSLCEGVFAEGLPTSVTAMRGLRNRAVEAVSPGYNGVNPQDPQLRRMANSILGQALAQGAQATGSRRGPDCATALASLSRYDEVNAKFAGSYVEEVPEAPGVGLVGQIVPGAPGRVVSATQDFLP